MPTAREAQLEEMEQFLQSAVHDLRAAHRRTGIPAELLQQSVGNDAEQSDLIAQIQQGLAKTEELLNGISRYANVLSHKNFSLTGFPAASAVRFALANLDREIRESGAEISVGELPVISGDRDR